MAVSWLMAVLLALFWVLLGLLLLLLVLLLPLLFLPFDIDLRLDSDLQAEEWEGEVTGTARWRARLRWGWWVLRGEWEGEQLALTRSEFRFCGLRPRQKDESKPKPEKPKAKPKRKKQKSRMTFEQILAYAEEAGRFMGRSVKDLGIQIHGALTYGFPDPAFTGWCEGIRWAALRSLPVAVTPEFQRPCFIGWTEVTGRTYGFRLVVAALKALRNPVIRAHLASKIRFRPLRYLLVRGGLS